jgi:hypothetical protein
MASDARHRGTLQQQLCPLATTKDERRLLSDGLILNYPKRLPVLSFDLAVDCLSNISQSLVAPLIGPSKSSNFRLTESTI